MCLRHCDLNDLSRTAVEYKCNHSCNHRITVKLWGTVLPVMKLNFAGLLGIKIIDRAGPFRDATPGASNFTNGSNLPPPCSQQTYRCVHEHDAVTECHSSRRMAAAAGTTSASAAGMSSDAEKPFPVGPYRRATALCRALQSAVASRCPACPRH